MKANPTPYHDLNAVLDEMVRSLQAILRDDLIGVYLQGSFAVGDFDAHSDVDFIVVVENELTEAQVTQLQEMHARIYALEIPWAQHLEGSYFSKTVLRDTSFNSYHGGDLWYIDNGSNSLERSSHCNTRLVRTVVRENGVILYGPLLDTLIDPIPVDELRREILAVITDWGGEILADPEKYRNHFYQTYLVLNFSRMLHEFIRGYPGSKRDGAEWAKSYFDPRWHELIDRTWAGRPDPASSIRRPPNPDDYAATLEFIQMVIDEANRITFPLE